MMCGSAKEFEINYPASVEEIRGTVMPIVEGVISTLSNAISTKSTAIVCLMLHGYLSMGEEEFYFRRGEDFRRDFASAVEEIKCEIERQLPRSVPEFLRHSYVRDIAQVLVQSAGEDMITLPERMELLRLFPSVFWGTELYYRKN